MLKKPYTVKLHGRSGIIYEENGKVLNIDAEMLSDEIDFVVYLDSIKCWEKPNDGEVISTEDISRIKENVTDALSRKGLVLEWQ